MTCARIIATTSIHKLTDDDWESVIATHLRGSFLAVQAAPERDDEAGSGAMVLISSTSALGNRGQANYATAKAGIQGLTKTLAIELRRFDVRVNCVAPGFIATAMTAQTAERLGVSFEDFQTAIASRCRSSRWASRRRRRGRLPLLGRRVVRQRSGGLRPRRPDPPQDLPRAHEFLTAEWFDRSDNAGSEVPR